MKSRSKFVVISFVFVLLSSSIETSVAATSLINKPCKKIGASTTSSGSKLVCTLISGKKLWKVTPRSKKTQVLTASPAIVPNFNLKYENYNVTATVIVSGKELVDSNVESAEAIVYAKVDGNYYKIGTSSWKVVSENFNAANNNVNFNFPLKNEYRGYELAVEIRYKNSVGSGEKALKAIIVPLVEPTPTATPTATPTPTPSTSPTPSAIPTPSPIPTPTATPAPVTSAAPIAEVGCSVNYISPLPYASQRMSVINMAWEKDSLGYVSVNMSIRNDNSMALRLVEFTFSFIHKGSIIITTSTLEGNHHFFIQNDAKFNSSDGISGAWMPGQTRVFKIPTNQMLECRSISVLSSGFTVKQGIGAD